MNTGTQRRDRVAVIARTKPVEALELARAIEDPWFRCQALSIAAVRVQDRRAHQHAIDGAFAAANELREPNRVVTASAWPVKALALAGQMSTVSSEVERLLQVASTEASPVRRADALRYLLEPPAPRRRLLPAVSRVNSRRRASPRCKAARETAKASRTSKRACPESPASIPSSP